jgi:hypothetical protein
VVEQLTIPTGMELSPITSTVPNISVTFIVDHPEENGMIVQMNILALEISVMLRSMDFASSIFEMF